MPADVKDPKSGVSAFQAAKILEQYAATNANVPGQGFAAVSAGKRHLLLGQSVSWLWSDRRQWWMSAIQRFWSWGERGRIRDRLERIALWLLDNASRV